MSVISYEILRGCYIASQELTCVTFDAYKQQIDQFEAVGEELIHRKQQLQTIFDVFETTIQSK